MSPTAGKEAGRRFLERPSAFLLTVVEIVVGREAGFDRRIDEMVAQLPVDRLVADPERPALPWVASAPRFLVLGLLEIRQHAVPIPALAAALAPQIIIGRVCRAYRPMPLIELVPPKTLPRGWYIVRPSSSARARSLNIQLTRGLANSRL